MTIRTNTLSYVLTVGDSSRDFDDNTPVGSVFLQLIFRFHRAAKKKDTCSMERILRLSNDLENEFPDEIKAVKVIRE